MILLLFLVLPVGARRVRREPGNSLGLTPTSLAEKKNDRRRASPSGESDGDAVGDDVHPARAPRGTAPLDYRRLHFGNGVSVGEIYHTMLSLMRAQVRIDHFVSKVGSFWGTLSLLPVIRPSKITFWDSSEATIRYGQFMVELLELSATRQDFATALIARNVAEFERLFGPITPSNQEHLFEMPPSFEIREQTFRMLSPASQEVYEELCMHQSHPWRIVDSDTLVGRLPLAEDVRLLPEETASGLGPREDCSEDGGLHEGEDGRRTQCTSSFAYGQGWLRNDDSFALTKAALHQATVVWRVMTFRPLALYEEMATDAAHRMRVAALLGNESRKDNILINFMDMHGGGEELESETLQSLKASSARLLFAQLNVQNRSDLLYEVEPRWTVDMVGRLSTVSFSDWDSEDLLPPEIFHSKPNSAAYSAICGRLPFPCLGNIPRDGSRWAPPLTDAWGVSADPMYTALFARVVEKLPPATPLPGEAAVHGFFAWSEDRGVFDLGKRSGLGAATVPQECGCLSSRQRRLAEYFQRAKCPVVLQVGGSASIAAFVTASDVDVTYVHLDESLIPSAKEWKVGEHTVTDVRIPLKLEEYMGLAQFWSSHGIPSPGMGACIAILGLDRGFFDTTSKTNAFRLHTQTAPLVVLESCVKTEGWRPNDCGDGDALREGGRILAESRQTRYFEEAIECQSDACIQASGSGCGIRALTYHTPSYRNPVPSWPKRRWFFEGRALLWPFWVPSFTAARPSTALRPPLPTWRDIDVPPPEPRVDYYVGQPDYIATAVLFVLILIASGFFGGSKPKTIRRWMGPSRYRGPAPSAHDQVVRPDFEKRSNAPKAQQDAG
jgi:hypothetical protein